LIYLLRHGDAEDGDGDADRRLTSNVICWERLSSNDPGCPAIPPLGLMKEILGKQLGL
jgi:hypothetical protein